MMKRLALIIVMIVAGTMYAKSTMLPDISDSTEFYMITCEPGQEAYTLFGHSAIRVIDKTQDFDVSFNWGVFSFEAPNFIGRFVVGETDYSLAVWRTDLFLAEYRERGSAVHQYHINLDSTEKQRLWALLCENYEPENRVYRYNFIYDNCATRVVDMIIASYDSIDASSFNMPTKSYREFVNSYTHSGSFLALGINLVFGRQADYVVTARESTTFPLQAMQFLEGVRVYRDSVAEPILTSHTFLCNPGNVDAWKKHSYTDTFLMCLLPLAIMALMIFLFFWRKRFHYEKISTEIVLWILFLLSLLLLFLKYFTIHPLVDFNNNLLWCSPMAGVLAVVLLLKRQRNLKCVVALITLICTFSFLFVLANHTQKVTAPLFCWWIMVFVCELMVCASHFHHFVKTLKRYYKGDKKHRHHHRHHHHWHHHHHHHHCDDGSATPPPLP